MLRYWCQKFINMILVLFGVVTIVFLLFNVLPGDPARMMLDQHEDSEQMVIIRKKYGFDKPLHQQYLLYLNDLSVISIHSAISDDYSYFNTDKYKGVQFLELGSYNLAIKYPYLRESFNKSGKKVTQIIAEALPNTILLALASIMISIFFGILLGVVSALFKDSWLDRIIAVVSTLGMSVPSFFSSIVFAWLFGYLWHKYTGLNMTGGFYELDNFGERIYLEWKNLLLPALVLGIRPLAVTVQLMRNSLLETLNQEYIKTAKAKGLSKFEVIKNHAVKNSLNPVVTSISGWFASMLAGSVFVEFIFGWNGIGKEIVDALNYQDLPVVMGAVLVVSVFFVIINIFVDLIYSFLDPRIRY